MYANIISISSDGERAQDLDLDCQPYKTVIYLRYPLNFFFFLSRNLHIAHKHIVKSQTSSFVNDVQVKTVCFSRNHKKSCTRRFLLIKFMEC